MSIVSPDLLPPDEDARLAATRRYDVLDAPPDGAFDRITALAARVCRVPISTLTVVDVDRIWFLSAYGLEADHTDRAPGLCASAILGELPYVVSDAATDRRTADNPLVRGEPGLRFYVGVPLATSDGYKLGTLNIGDVEPREISADQLKTLQDLAAIVMDELELRLAARRAVRAESTREALRLRDAIVAGISHEMRTPLAVLNGILGVEQASLDEQAAQEQEAQGPGPGGQEQGGQEQGGQEQGGQEQVANEPVDDAHPLPAEMHAMMHRQVRHLDWLLKQFLDYASLEGDRPPVVELEPVDLRELVAEAAEVFTDRAPVRVATAGGPAIAMADRDRTWQICLELLNNAARFGPTDAEVELRVGTGDDDRVRVTVTDRGPGIAPELRERMFEPTFRHSDSTGSGVGLYVSQVFARAQGGDIEVRSEPGQGSSFSLVLPAAR